MESTDIELIEMVRGGDSDSFRYIVDRHTRLIHRVAYRITGNSADADDVVQETFLRAYRQIHTYQSRASVATWLHRIAVNCALDLIDSRRRRDSRFEAVEDMSLLPSADAAPDRRAHAAEVQRAIDTAMNGLTAKERAAFVLRHFEGVPLEEIGTILGTRLNATKNTIFRAVKKLREELQPYTGSTV